MIPQLRQDILNAIATHWKKYHYGPSMRDLQATTGNHSTSVISNNLDALICKGLVTRDPGIARSIRLTKEGETAIVA